MLLAEDGKTCRVEQYDGAEPAIRVVRLKVMLERIGVGRSTAYDWMNPRSPRYDPTFPHSIKLSGGRRGCGAVGWIESDIRRWIESRVAAGRALSAVTAVDNSRHQMACNINGVVVGGQGQ